MTVTFMLRKASEVADRWRQHTVHPDCCPLSSDLRPQASISVAVPVLARISAPFTRTESATAGHKGSNSERDWPPTFMDALKLVCKHKLQRRGRQAVGVVVVHMMTAAASSSTLRWSVKRETLVSPAANRCPGQFLEPKMDNTARPKSTENAIEEKKNQLTKIDRNLVKENRRS